MPYSIKGRDDHHLHDDSADLMFKPPRPLERYWQAICCGSEVLDTALGWTSFGFSEASAQRYPHPTIFRLLGYNRFGLDTNAKLIYVLRPPNGVYIIWLYVEAALASGIDVFAN
jgi:hypothetical protein